MATTKRVWVLIAPLLVSAGLGFLLAEGHLNFGAGEKDIVLVLPLILLSFLFLVAGSLTWRSQVSFKAWVLKSMMYSVLILVCLWLFLLAYSVATTR